MMQERYDAGLKFWPKAGCIIPILLASTVTLWYMLSCQPAAPQVDDTPNWAQLRIARRLCSDSAHIPAVSAHPMDALQIQVTLKQGTTIRDCYVQLGRITYLSEIGRR